MVDDLNAIHGPAAELAAAHDLTTRGDGNVGLILTGVHRHTTMDAAPTGLQTVPLGYLQPLEARYALTAVADRHDATFDPSGLDLAVQRAGGLPVALQAWGDALWQSAHSNQPADLDLIEATAEATLGRYYARIWSAMTDHDRAYVAAIANQFGGAVPAGDAARRAGYDSAQAASPLRAKLIDQGIIQAPQRGYIQLAIAGLGRWYTHTRHLAQRGTKALRPQTHNDTPTRTMAADQPAPCLSLLHKPCVGSVT